MVSLAGPDPMALGLTLSIAISLLVIGPLLIIFFRTRSQPNSFMWKAIYVPRTWWGDPSQRTHPVFDPIPGGSPFKSILQLIKGSPLELIPPQQPSIQSQKEIHPSFMTDEEVHLRFLGLCLRLALLELLLGLPLFIALFAAGVPSSPSSPIIASLENFTVFRLLYHYDIEPSSFSTRLTLWAILAIIVGTILTFFLILSEWHYLRRNIQRFAREKCGNLKIVYLPFQPHGGFEEVGEKRMAHWVRACGLGPVGAEGSGAAITAYKKQNSSRPSQHFSKHFRSSLLPNRNRATHLGPDSNRCSPQDSTTSPPITLSPHHQPSSDLEQPLPSESRGVIIHGIFTISQLDRLYSLSEKRRKVLDDLELQEAKYVAGFLPEEAYDTNHAGFKRNKDSKPRRKADGDKSSEEQVTPYGPLGLYKLDAKPREKSRIDWRASSHRLSHIMGFEGLRSRVDQPVKANESDLKELHFCFDEVLEDLKLPNEVYQQKWAIGKEVARQVDGSFLNVSPEKPPSVRSQSNHSHKDNSKDGLLDSALVASPVSIQAATIRSDRSLLDSAPSRSWNPPLARSPLASLADTDDSHEYPPPSSTAPTTASINSTDSKPGPQERVNAPSLIVTNVELGLEESGTRNRRSLPTEHPGIDRLDEINPLSQSASSPNLRHSPHILSSPREDVDVSTEKDPIIPSLFEIPEVMATENLLLQPVVNSNLNKHELKGFFASSQKKTTPENFSQSYSDPLEPKLKLHRFVDSEEIEELYHSIRQNRSQLKRLNQQFLEEKRKAVRDMEDGINGSVLGWIIVGKGVDLIQGALPIDGMTREDVNWQALGRVKRLPHNRTFWILFLGLFVVVAIIIIAVTILSMAATPELPKFSSIFLTLQNQAGLKLGFLSITVPSTVLFILLFPSISLISYLALNFSEYPSKAAGQLLCVKAIFILIFGCFLVWFLLCGSMMNQILQIEDDMGIVDRFSICISAISNSFLAFQCILAIIVPTILLTQPGRWKKIRDALNRPQTPRQRVLSFWPQQINSGFSRGATLMAVSVLLLFSSIAPLTILPSVVFFGYMILVQRRNLHYVYRREGQSGGKTELKMITMLCGFLALQSSFLALILFSRQRWALATFAGIIGVWILIVCVLMLYQDSNYVGKSILPDESRLALEVFEGGPGGTKDGVSLASPSEKSFGTRSKKHPQPLDSLFDLVNSTLTDPDVQVHRPVPLPSEMVDDLVDTRLALRRYPDAPPHLPCLPWRNPYLSVREMLYPPVLLQTVPAIWLPKNGIAAEEARDLKQYWDLEAFYEEGISTKELNLI